MADIVTSYQTQKESLASDYLKQLETARRAQQLARQQTEEQAALAQRQMQQGLYKRGLVGTGVQQLGQIQGQLALSSQLNQQAMQQSATEQGMYQTYKTNLQALEDKRSSMVGQIEALAANSKLTGTNLSDYIVKQAQAKGITLTTDEKDAMESNALQAQITTGLINSGAATIDEKTGQLVSRPGYETNEIIDLAVNEYLNSKNTSVSWGDAGVMFGELLTEAAAGFAIGSIVPGIGNVAGTIVGAVVGTVVGLGRMIWGAIERGNLGKRELSAATQTLQGSAMLDPTTKFLDAAKGNGSVDSITFRGEVEGKGTLNDKYKITFTDGDGIKRSIEVYGFELMTVAASIDLLGGSQYTGISDSVKDQLKKQLEDARVSDFRELFLSGTQYKAAQQLYDTYQPGWSNTATTTTTGDTTNQ